MRTLTESQLKELKAIIDNELEARSINVETTLVQRTDARGEVRFDLTSTNFRTVPAIHKNLKIENFASGIGRDEEDRKEVLRAWVDVSCRYDGNGVNLFTVWAWFDEKSLDLLKVSRSFNRN